MTDRPWVYIAGPYSQGDPVTNTRAACEAGDRVWAVGFMPVVPHSNLIWHAMHPKPVAFWYDYDLHLLRRCEHLIRLPGDSPGADVECTKAIEWQIPCYLGVDHFIRSVCIDRNFASPAHA